MESAAYFREKAAQDRRLAQFIYKNDDSTRVELLAMAEEFEAKARTYASQDSAERSEPTDK